MKNLKTDKMFLQLSEMSNEDRGKLITKNKQDLENYFDCDLVIHKYGQQPNNENEILSYKNPLANIGELINIVEFAPRS